MKVYLDTSVILRFLLNQPGCIPDWGQWAEAATSEVTRAEAMRKGDQLRLQGVFQDEEVAAYTQSLDQILERLSTIALNRVILERASFSFPTVIGTLDAIHLATAMLWQEKIKEKIVFLTHDIRQGRAAIALGFQVQGLA